MKSILCLFCLGWSIDAQAQTWAPGQTIDDSVSVQITDEGLNSLGALASVLVPGSIEIPEVADGSSGSWLGCLADWGYSLSNAWVNAQIIDTVITPDWGMLNLNIELLVNINDANDPFQTSFEAVCLETNCPGYVDPFPVYVSTTIAFQVVTDADGHDLGLS